MNWQEWHKSMPKLTESEIRVSIISWDACKQEIINQIKRDGMRMVNSYTIIEEIEKL